MVRAFRTLMVPLCDHLFRVSVRASRRKYCKGFSNLIVPFCDHMFRVSVRASRRKWALGFRWTVKLLWKRDAWGVSPRNLVLVKWLGSPYWCSGQLVAVDDKSGRERQKIERN